MIFQDLLFFLLGGLGGGFPNWKSHSDFFVLIFFSFLNLMVTCDQQEQVLFSQKVLLWIFLEIRYLIWRYAGLNRLLVGSGLNPLTTELQQDDRTVCCGHTDVWTFMYLLDTLDL